KKEWREAFSWREPLPEGWDYYLLNTLAARSVARFAKSRLGAELKESATLWGRKNGKDVYRVTFCLRIPERAAPTPK
ncbi:MAG TPA: NMD3-related protein, partial [Thermoplasmata archaeon]|nr:NMD3-related protein [Thermoplasmata archaeon]